MSRVCHIDGFSRDILPLALASVRTPSELQSTTYININGPHLMPIHSCVGLCWRDFLESLNKIAYVCLSICDIRHHRLIYFDEDMCIQTPQSLYTHKETMLLHDIL